MVHRPTDFGAQRHGIDHVEAGLGRAIVGREQRGGARAERTVGEQLDRADAEHVIAHTARESELDRRIKPRVRQVHQHAQRRAFGRAHLTQHELRLAAFEVVHARDAARIQQWQGSPHRAGIAGMAGRQQARA